MTLALHNIWMAYDKKDTYVLHGITLSLTEGVYGLLGPNGAGKTTLMNIITGNLIQRRGSVRFNGKDMRDMGKEYRSLLGYMPQQQSLYDEFSGEEFLWYMASLKGMKKKETKERTDALLEMVNLASERSHKIKKYSGGMKQRLLIAQALLNDPKILILDEPTAGLDPMERINVRNYIDKISKDKIIILSTHIVSDVEKISKEIIIMNHGRVIQKGNLAMLANGLREKDMDLETIYTRYMEMENSV